MRHFLVACFPTSLLILSLATIGTGIELQTITMNTRLEGVANGLPAKAVKRIRNLQNRGRYAEAANLCEKLEKQGHSDSGLLHLHGLALRGLRDFKQAIDKLTAAYDLDPENISLINSLGVVLLDEGRLETAIELFKHATKIDQKDYLSWMNLGIALRKADRFQAAELAFTCAHHIDRSATEPLLNLADLLIDLRALDRAMEFLGKLETDSVVPKHQLQLKQMQVAARMQDFTLIEAIYSRINRKKLNTNELAQLENIWAFHLEMQEDYESAIGVLEPVIKMRSPHRAQIMSQLGILYSKTNRNAEALKLHEQLLKEYPDHVAGRYNLGLLQFRTGNIAEGYKNHEARWEWKEFPSPRRRFDMPQWNGENLSEKKILVWREQGLGDEVRFASLIPELLELGARVTFECTPKIIPVWQRSFPKARIQPEGPVECRGHEDYSAFDFHVPIGSLGAFLRKDMDSFGELQKPWIARNDSLESAIRKQLSVDNDELLVGICWRSSNQVVSRSRYFFRIEQFEPLKNLPGVKWINAQYDANREEIETVRNLGLPLHDYPNIDQKDDLVTASGLLGACDLVISVGGAVADLTGGLGVPTLYITRENSEVFLGTDHVPWFPAARSYPMKPYCGDEIISQIVADWSEIASWVKSTPRDRSIQAENNTESGNLDLDLDQLISMSELVIKP